MPVPGKRPDEPGEPYDLVGAGALWPIRAGLGVFAARRRRGWGSTRDSARSAGRDRGGDDLRCRDPRRRGGPPRS